MVFVHLIFALSFALILTAAFAVGSRSRGPWENLVVFFFVLFLASWAGGLWLAPFGPVLWGATWLPFFLAGLLVLLILMAALPTSGRESTVELVDKRERAAELRAAVTALGVFFWVLIVLLIVGIVVRYL